VSRSRDAGTPRAPRRFAGERVDRYRYRIPRQGKMRGDALVFADERLLAELEGDEALGQIVNVAQLPGLVGPAIAMPDVHWGYGFPIGGVAAFDPRSGVISPGGVGYDINCGVRLLAVPLSAAEAAPRLRRLVDRLFADIPAGVGSARSDLSLADRELDRVLADGARWAVGRGYGTAQDLEAIEAGGRLTPADPGQVSARARQRGRDQLGTLGSGNHFCEIGRVEEVHHATAAAELGLGLGRLVVLIHCGSRGLGHQTCDDFLDRMLAASRKYGIELPDPQLCAAPLGSPDAEAYWGAMNAAANFAFANRQVITHFVRGALAATFGDRVAAGTRLVYDVAHNIAKLEEHWVGDRQRRVCVHRKGATRALPPGHPELAPRFRELGQPVLIPGDMGRASYVLLGTEQAARETFASCCHGAGRRMSRHAAKRAAKHRDLVAELAAQGVIVRAASRATVDEEMPEAYKDVSRVVDIVAGAGIAEIVARLRPLGVVKG